MHKLSMNAGAGKAELKLQEALLVVPNTVLCSEMGVHISPCGRFLAACVAVRTQLLTQGWG